MKKRMIIQLVVLIGLLAGPNWISPNTAMADQAIYPYSFSLVSLEPFYRQILEEVTEKAARMAYNYEARPVIGTIVRDLADPSGRGTFVGQDLARFLRAGMNQENQFLVYSREQVSRSLGHLLNTDRPFTAEGMAELQENVPLLFKKPVHLIIGGNIWKTPENQLKALVYLFPFYHPLTPVEKESPLIHLERLYFTSPVLSPEELKKALIPASEGPKTLALEPGYGRLVIISSYHQEKSREQERQYMVRLESGPSADRPGALLALKQMELGDPENVNCWLDDQKLYSFEDSRKSDHRGFYHTILSGFGADQVWFDGEVPQGSHHLVFSIFPVNSVYKKAISYSFQMKSGVTTYLLVTALGRPKTNPDISVKMVVDPQNRPYPF